MRPKSRPGRTPECTEAIWEFKRARRRRRADNSEENHIAFQLARRHKKTTINKALRNEHRNRISEIQEMQDVWKIAKWAKNRGIPKTSFTPDLKNSAGQPQKTTQGKAEALKNSMFPTPPPADVNGIEGTQYPPPIRTPMIKTHETKKAIKESSPDKAPGPDQIPNRVLQMAESQLTEPLTNLFNNCLENGYYPQPLRCST